MGLKTVIADNDPVARQLHRKLVEEVAGYAVWFCTGSATAVLRCLNGDDPGLLLLDLELPDADGLDLVKEIRRRDLPVDIIVVTALKDVATVGKVLRYGVFDFVIKPYAPERLRLSVEAYFARRLSLMCRTEVDQEWMDHYGAVRPLNSLPKERLPKGFHRLTLSRVVTYLEQSRESVSAEEVATGVGFSRATARRYLEYLVRSGLALSELQYGAVGRPTIRYRLSCHKE
jgi:two-component system response regulator DctR